MQNLIIGAASALAGFACLALVWTFVIRPRLNTFRARGYRFDVQNGTLVITLPRAENKRVFSGRIDRLTAKTKNGQDEHTRHQCATDFIETTYTIVGNAVFEDKRTTHNKAYTYAVKGERYAILTLTEIRTEDLTRPLCEKTKMASCIRGLILNAERYQPNECDMRLTRSDAFVAKMWLRRQGMTKNVDLGDMEANFLTQVNAAREKYRLQFGYQGTQLDHIGIAQNLAPMSYSLLHNDMMMTIYSHEYQASRRALVVDIHFETEVFSDGRPTLTHAFYDRVSAVISPAMRDAVEAELKRRGAKPITVKHRN